MYGHKQPFYGVNQTDASSVWDGEKKKTAVSNSSPQEINESYGQMTFDPSNTQTHIHFDAWSFLELTST